MADNQDTGKHTNNNAGENINAESPVSGQPDAGGLSGCKKEKHHLIKNRWLRRIVKTLSGILIFILLVPITLYIPVVQTFVKNVACNYVYKSTGMKIEIGRFLLKFPLDVSLDKVLVLDQKADTMVRAENVLADVKLLPLLGLDVKLNKLLLKEGYYRMVSSDSSMIMKVNAGLLEVDNKSSMDIAKSQLMLNEALLKRGSIELYMDVWKQTRQDTATAGTPFVIIANKLKLEDFTFGMSMLPTIDTMYVSARDITLDGGRVDLSKNKVSWKKVSVKDGSGQYITPTAEWISAHPAPETPPSTSAPMVIKGDSISLDSFKFLYAVKGAKPSSGFDPSYMDLDDIFISMKDFYNEAVNLRLPITRLQARERSGLQLVSGQGLVCLDSAGLKLKDININTLYSSVRGSADLPFALMELRPEAPVYADVKVSLGMPDIDSFLPDFKSYTAKFKSRTPLQAELFAEGSLSSVDINKLNVALRDVISLRANGYADNPLDIKRLKGEVEFEGDLADPSVVQAFTGMKDIKVPVLKLRGEASADHENYSADFDLLTSAGDIAGNGKVGMNSEKYNVDIYIDSFDVSEIMPETGIGKVSASIMAEGRGFNPISGKSVTNAKLDIDNITYRHKVYNDIDANVVIHPDGVMELTANSRNPGIDFYLEGTGMIRPDDYTFDIKTTIRDVDLKELGLSETMNSGKGLLSLQGSASPEKWLYDMKLRVEDLDWNLPNQYIHIPTGITAVLKADKFMIDLEVESYLTNVRFKSENGLKDLISSFEKVSEVIDSQIKNKSVEIDVLSETMPRFNLSMNASGKGLISQFVVPQGLSLDTIYGGFSNDSLFHGNISLYNFEKGTLELDTIRLDLSQRGSLLDYRMHLGNRPGTLDEFAVANLRGYLGSNRLGAYITQRNIKGEEGYKIGLAAALQDSIVSLHFSPLESTIAYMPWTFNDDNFVDFNIYNRKVDADLEARSNESEVVLRTEPLESGLDKLLVKLSNIRIQDFTKMVIGAPPITGEINSDLEIMYDGSTLQGSGNIGLNNLVYEKSRLGDFLLNLKAGLEGGGRSGVNADLIANGHPALSVYASLRPDSVGLSPDSIGVTVNDFPLSLANPFIAPNASLTGFLRGKMRMDGSFTKPILNGELGFKDASATITMAGATLRLDTVPLTVTNSIVRFDDFDIFGANGNPICIDGDVNITDMSNILLNLTAKADNCQLIKSNSKSKADIFGKLFINLDGSVRGSMNLMDVRATLNILGTSDVTYRLNTVSSDMSSISNNNVVKFVNFNDTTEVADADSLARQSSMRIRANLIVSPGTQAAVIISGNGSGNVELQPSGNLNYFQNYMGDMKLNGKLYLGQGFVKYAVPMVFDKKFDVDANSNVSWTGDVLNPQLDITATNSLKASTNSSGNSRLVNFIVTLKATGTLSAPKVAFNLSTNDDLTIQNELQSMSADQRQTQAMNLLLYGQYTGQNTKANANLGGNMLYGFLESQLNKWAAKAIRGVDLSFGIDQFENGKNGSGTTETSYSYQVSKSLFNNRLKIHVGGNYSTDSSADENLSQNLINDISVEYLLKQTETTNMSVRLFRHTGFESILEGEITETGAGFLLKRKLDNLLHVFRLNYNRKNSSNDAQSNHHEAMDTVDVKHDKVHENADSIVRKEEDNE